MFSDQGSHLRGLFLTSGPQREGLGYAVADVKGAAEK
jgi:hypothetical protein